VPASIDEGIRYMSDPAAELAKLGSNGPARVNAVERWLDATGLGVWKVGMATAAQVEQMERHMVQQGAARFTQSPSAAPAGARIPNFEKLSFEQRRFAQDQLASRRGR
jgi:hypothetical protein